MRSEQQYVKKINSPEFRNVIYKLLQFIKVDGYGVSFKNYGKKCEMVLIDEQSQKEIYNIGNIDDVIDQFLEEENKTPDKLTYTKVFSVLQNIIDHYIEQIEKVTNGKQVFFFAKRHKFLIFVYSLLNLLVKVENIKNIKPFVVDNDSIKLDGKPVYTFQEDFLYNSSPLRNLYVELANALHKIFE